MLHLTRISPKPQRVTSLARQIQNSRNYAQHVTTTSKIQTFNCIQPQTPRTPIAPSITRPFTTTPSLQKKKDKNNDSKKAASEDDDTSPKKNKKKESEPATSDDPLDLQELNKGIENAVRRLSDDVSKLSVGGRFNTEAIESLRVHLVKGSKESVRLGELAQLIPKGGRMVTVLVFEEEHTKPIASAIVSSNLSLNPQQDPHNALQLNIPIPPPTKESRDQTVQVAKSAMEKAAGAIRDSRGSVNKRLQDAQKKKVATPDQVRKAREQMEKLTEKGQKEVKDLFETSKKNLERA